MVKTLHGKVINYNQLRYVASRNDFLHIDEKKSVDAKIDASEPLLFMPTDIKEMHLQDVKYQKAKYKICVYGVLEDGRKTTVILDGITPYFDIWLKDQTPDGIKKEANEIWSELLEDRETEPDTDKEYEIIETTPFMGYRVKKEKIMRIYFKKIRNRSKAIKYVRDKGYYRDSNGDSRTFHDDKSCYYRVVCRDYRISYSQWTEISDYTIENHSSFKDCVYRVNIDKYKKYEGDILNNPSLAKDKTMVCTWDIETHGFEGSVPQPENEDENMFMIGMTFHWYHSKDSIFQVCLVDNDSAPNPDYLTVVCKTEERLIKAMGKILEKMKPEYLVGFNDSTYDWRWVIERGRKYRGCISKLASCMSPEIPYKPFTDLNVYKWTYKEEKVKLEVGMDAIGSTLRLPGCITLDVRTIFRKLYPTAESSSLKWFLKKNKLGGKKDMPYQELFRIYRVSLAIKEISNKVQDTDCKNIILEYLGDEFSNNDKLMASACDYCVTDAKRCHELLKIRDVIMDKREVSGYSYTSMNDAFYRADGSKVRNLVIARGQIRGMSFSNIARGRLADAKYPGAFVFPPKKGLVTSKLTPEERIEKNKTELKKNPHHTSPWLLIIELEIKKIKEAVKDIGACPDEKAIAKWEEDNSYKFQKCSVDFLLEKTGRPITGLDFSSLYPSLIMAYNLSPEYIIRTKLEARKVFKEGVHTLHRIEFPFNGQKVRAWSIRHDNKIETDKKDCKFGIYPAILKELFDLRKKYKKSMNVWKDKLEHMNTMSREQLDLVSEEYENVNFQYNYWNTKQKALKVFMNTFYGETGNQVSPFFMLPIAGGITTAGKHNIKMVFKEVTKKGWETKYGDTDSLYIGAPEKYFEEVDRLYYSGEKDKDWYWNQLVLITFDKIKEINKYVNDLLKADNGTSFLRMAYEEALFPVAYLAKKKYYGIEHETVPNFKFKHLFVRGLEIKKRGTSDFLRNVFEKGIMNKSVLKENYKTLMELVIDQIEYIYSDMKTSFDDFIKTDVYKPNKQNVKIQTFAKRMKKLGMPVKPYERFQYVIVKKYPYWFDHRGRKHDLQIGDKMEFVHVAKEQKMEIDLDYYMKGSVNGQLARAIVYHPDFHVEPVDDSPEALKKADEKTYENAKKWVAAYCKKFYAPYANKGKIYQKIFRGANKIVTTALKDKMNGEMLNAVKGAYDIDNIAVWIDEKAKKVADKSTKNYGKDYVEDILEKVRDEVRKGYMKETDQYEAVDTKNYDDMDTEAFIEEMNSKYLMPRTKEDVKLGRPGRPRQLQNEKKNLNKKGKAELRSLIKKAKDAKVEEMSKFYFAGKDSIHKKHTQEFRIESYALERDIYNSIDKIKLLLSSHTNVILNISNKIKQIINVDGKFEEAGDNIDEDIMDKFSEIPDEKLLEDAKKEINKLYRNDKFIESVNLFNTTYKKLIENYINMNKTNLVVDYLKNIRDSKLRIYSLRGNY